MLERIGYRRSVSVVVHVNAIALMPCPPERFRIAEGAAREDCAGVREHQR